jgi:predicted RNase H-like HicB family nuclease
VKVSIELDREDDGRWIAEALELPGVMTYGSTREEAIIDTERLAIEVITDRIRHGELPESEAGISIQEPTSFQYELVDPHPDIEFDAISRTWTTELARNFEIDALPVKWMRLARVSHEACPDMLFNHSLCACCEIRGYTGYCCTDHIFVRCDQNCAADVMRTIAHEFRHLHQDKRMGCDWRTESREDAEKDAEAFEASSYVQTRIADILKTTGT